MIKLSKELDIKGKKVIFTESMGEEDYAEYDGKDFRVVEVYLDHATCKEKGGCDPIALPMIKIELIENPSVTFNAWADEIGSHKVIDIFCSGIHAAQPLYDSYVNTPGAEGFDSTKVLSLKDYTMESERFNPYEKGTCEYEIFTKGFECMYFK